MRTESGDFLIRRPRNGEVMETFRFSYIEMVSKISLGVDMDTIVLLLQYYCGAFSDFSC